MIESDDTPSSDQDEKGICRGEYVTPTLIDYGAVAELTEGPPSGIAADAGIFS